MNDPEKGRTIIEELVLAQSIYFTDNQSEKGITIEENSITGQPLKVKREGKNTIIDASNHIIEFRELG